MDRQVETEKGGNYMWLWIGLGILVLILIIAFISMQKNKAGVSSYQEVVNQNQISTRFISTLTGNQESPIVITNAQGNATVLFTQDGRVAYRVEFNNLGSPYKSAHFHVGPPGIAGPIVKDISNNFISTNSNRTSGIIEGTWSVTDDQPFDRQNLVDLLAGRLYFNVHSQVYPDGEIRGQILSR